MFIPAKTFLLYSEGLGFESLMVIATQHLYDTYMRQRASFPFKMTLLVY